MEERLVFSVDEVAEILNVCVPTVHKGVRNGTIPSIKLGRRILVPKAALEKKLAEVGQSIK